MPQLAASKSLLVTKPQLQLALFILIFQGITFRIALVPEIRRFACLFTDSDKTGCQQTARPRIAERQIGFESDRLVWEFGDLKSMKRGDLQ